MHDVFHSLTGISQGRGSPVAAARGFTRPEARGPNHGWDDEGAKGNSLRLQTGLFLPRVVGFRKLPWDGTGASV